jgi:hypothetical protein
VTIDKAIDWVYVIEDFNELFENKKDRLDLIQEGQALPVVWYESFKQTKNYDQNVISNYDQYTNKIKPKNKN